MTLEEQIAHYKAVRGRIATAHLDGAREARERESQLQREEARKEMQRQVRQKRQDDAIRAALEQYADRKMLIVKDCASKHGVEVADIFGHCKIHKILAARWEAIYRIKTTVKISHAALGKWMAGRDHTSIMYVMEQYEKSLARSEAKVALEGKTRDRS